MSTFVLVDFRDEVFHCLLSSCISHCNNIVSESMSNIVRISRDDIFLQTERNSGQRLHLYTRSILVTLEMYLIAFQRFTFETIISLPRIGVLNSSSLSLNNIGVFIKPL